MKITRQHANHEIFSCLVFEEDDDATIIISLKSLKIADIARRNLFLFLRI